MNRITQQRIGIVVGVLLIAAAVVANKKISASKTPPPRKEKKVAAIPPVETLVVSNENIATSLDIQGQLVAFDKIDIFTEVTGILEQTSKPFKKGTYFPKDALLLQIDNEEARLSVLSQKSNLLNAVTQMMPDLKIDYPQSFTNWETYLRNFDVTQPLKAFPTPVNDQEKYFIASRNLLGQFYTIKSAEARLEKYSIYAPFGGIISQGNLASGTLVRSGQQLGTLMNTSNYELETTVALGDLKFIKVGNPVNLTSTDIEGSWKGRIKRISNQIDPNTQTVTVYVAVNGRNLREGMYLKGNIAGSSIGSGVRIPRELLIDQRAVYIIQDSTLQLTNVNVVKISDNQAIIRGLNDGTVLLGEDFINAYDGMKVRPEKKSTVAKK